MPPKRAPNELQAFVEEQRRLAAYEIALHLVEDARSITRAIRDARTREEGQSSQHRSVAFGIMVDKLAVLMSGANGGRYGSGAAAYGVDQAAVLKEIRPATPRALPSGPIR